jgi:putative solute:sodium symporter small subunit
MNDPKTSLLTEGDAWVYDAAFRNQGPLSCQQIGSPHPGRASMTELTEEQKQAYWRYNIWLTALLLIIWFVTAYIISGLLAGWLNQFTLLGFPLGYYMAAQGSLAIFVIEIAVYAHLMNKKDREYGLVAEE